MSSLLVVVLFSTEQPDFTILLRLYRGCETSSRSAPPPCRLTNFRESRKPLDPPPQMHTHTHNDHQTPELLPGNAGKVPALLFVFKRRRPLKFLTTRIHNLVNCWRKQWLFLGRFEKCNSTKTTDSQNCPVIKALRPNNIRCGVRTKESAHTTPWI